MDAIKESFESLFITSIASILLIVLGIIYFGVTLLVIKLASRAVFGPGLQANWAVLAAAILAFGAILAGAIEKGS